MKKLIFFLIFIILLISTSANNVNYLFRNISTDNGLVCTQVHAILQDKKGFLWVGTTDGLNKYDGFSFREYLPEKSNKNSIQAYNISSLYQDNNGFIWIFFSSGELSYYNPLTDTFTNFSIQQLKKITPNFTRMTCFFEGINNQVFIGTDGGLLIFDSESKELSAVEPKESFVSSSNIKNITKDAQNNVWMATSDGFVKYSTQSKKFSNYTLQNAIISYIFVDSQNKIWIGTTNSGLYKLNLSTTGKYSYSKIPVISNHIYQILEGQKGELWVSTKKGVSLYNCAGNTYILKNNFFNSTNYYYSSKELFKIEILKDNTGNIWFGDLRVENGLYYYSQKNEKMEAIFADPQNPYALQQYGITTMYIDRSNNLWIGHNNAGLSVCSLTESPFNLTSIKTKFSEISSNHIHALCEDYNQNLWIGTDKGLDVIDAGTSKVSKHYSYNSKIKSTALSGRIPGCIVEDKNRNIWVGYLGSNPDLINPKENSIKSFTYDESYTNSAFFWRTMSIAIDKNNTPWFTTGSAGLAKYNNDGKSFTYYTPGPVRNAKIIPKFSTKNHISDYSLYSVCFDKNENLWIGTDFGGLCRFDSKTERFENFLHSENDSTSISSNFVRYVYCDSNNEIWAGTNSGLDKFEKKTKTFTHYSISNGLVGNTIQGIVEGEKNVLYISSNSGISRFDIESKTFTNFTTRNGLLSNEYSTGACLKRKSGELVFGSVNKGVVSFFPKKLMLTPSKPKVLISGLKLKNKELKIGENELLKQQILYTKEIEIPYVESRDMVIEFLAINYILPNSSVYRYKLEGFDSDWKNTDFLSRVAVYSQLRQGKYIFHVSASNDGKNWGEPTSLKIIIRSPWWQSWWFISSLALFILGIIYLIYKIRLKEYKKRQIVLEKEVLDRTAKLKHAVNEVELKNTELGTVNSQLELQNNEILLISNQLRELNETKTEFFTNISHELRTPLTIIKGMFETVTSKLDKKSYTKFAEPIHVIERNILLLIRHVNQLLTISLLDKGKIIPKISEHDLNKFLNEISDTFSVISEKYNVSFKSYISEKITLGYFDIEIIEHVILNLISNALKYTPDGGEIVFSVFPTTKGDTEYIYVTVEDNGIGIKEEEKDKIFDRFYRNQHTEYQRFESSGIGLAYTKEMISIHQGEITFQSQYKKGSIFKINFSISKSAYPENWICKPDEINYVRKDYFRELTINTKEVENIDSFDKDELPLILVVEDNIDLCSYLKQLLSDAYRIEIANNGKEGWAKASELLPDLIISDIMMPHMSGLELCKEIKMSEHTSHIPVILLTARTTEKQQIEGLETGADDYITKPFNSDVLTTKIKNIIEQKIRLKQFFSSGFNVEQPGQGLPEDERVFLEKATKVVLDNLQNVDFDVDEFCSHIFMSRTNLFRKLKAVTGQSATSFTRTIRLKQAAILLKNPIYSVNEVASMVGFSDPNYFARCFKELFGSTPSNY